MAVGHGICVLAITSSWARGVKSERERVGNTLQDHRSYHFLRRLEAALDYRAVKLQTKTESTERQAWYRQQTTQA